MELLEKIANVGGVPVRLYSFDGARWFSSKRDLERWHRDHDKIAREIMRARKP